MHEAGALLAIFPFTRAHAAADIASVRLLRNPLVSWEPLIVTINSPKLYQVQQCSIVVTIVSKQNHTFGFISRVSYEYNNL